MAELTVKEKLQPSLLDRLTDDAPDQKTEPRSRRVMNVRQLRKYVRRDLAWLLNCGHLESTEDLSLYPEVQSSVINFGIRELSGRTVSAMKEKDLERLIRDAILRYEPRILPNTIRVSASVSRDEMSINSVSYTVEGQLWAQPVPTQLYLRTEVDLDTGSVRVAEQ